MSGRLIISGATRGIGKSIALRFASEGFDIAFCSRTPKDIEAFSHQLSHDYSIQNRGFTADMSKAPEVKKFASDALNFLGGCDVLINNAGVFMPGSIEKEEDETFEFQMAINLGSAYYLTKSLIPELKKGIRPHIFNMCSIASIKAYPNGASYCISKHAMLGLSRVLREELIPHGVCVTSVMPGATLTESWGDVSEPATRFMRPADIADSVWMAYQINEHTNIEELLMRPLQGDI